MREKKCAKLSHKKLDKYQIAIIKHGTSHRRRGDCFLVDHSNSEVRDQAFIQRYFF